jgi:hypothetical protein
MVFRHFGYVNLPIKNRSIKEKVELITSHSVTEMMDDLSWPTLKERRIKTRLINCYKISNNKMEIPYTDIFIPNQSKTRTSHSKTFRQLPCKKNRFKYSFFCNTIPDWYKLSETTLYRLVFIRRSLSVGQLRSSIISVILLVLW